MKIYIQLCTVLRRIRTIKINDEILVLLRTTYVTAPVSSLSQHLLVVGIKIAYTVDYNSCFNNLAQAVGQQLKPMLHL